MPKFRIPQGQSDVLPTDLSNGPQDTTKPNEAAAASQPRPQAEPHARHRKPPVPNGLGKHRPSGHGLHKPGSDRGPSPHHDFNGLPHTHFNPMKSGGGTHPDMKSHDASDSDRPKHDNDRPGKHHDHGPSKHNSAHNPLHHGGKHGSSDSSPHKPGLGQKLATNFIPGYGLAAGLGRKMHKHSPLRKLNHAFNPFARAESKLKRQIKGTTRDAGGTFGSLLVMHVMNVLREIMLLLMEIATKVVSAIAHAAGAIMAVIHAVATAAGAVFGAIGSVLGVSAHIVGGVVFTAAAACAIVGTGSFLSSKDMESVGCAIQQVASAPSTADKISGAAGEWTHKGTKAYNLAKDIFAGAKGMGYNDNGAAGVVGNAEAEGAATGQLDEGEHDGSGDGGQGIFQFTPGATGGYTLEKYESWCKSHHKSPWSNAQTEIEGIMAVKSHPPKSPGSPSKGASNFYYACEDGVDNGTLGMRESNAEKAYSMFKGVGGEKASDNDAAAGNESGAACKKGSGDDDDTGDGSDIIRYGEKYLGLPYTEDPRRNQGGKDIAAGKPKKDTDPTDCAGFVWGVMKHLHYKVTPGEPWTTPPEQHFSGCKHISASETHAGIALVENDNGDPHTGFLKEKWRGKATKFLDEDGGSALGHDVGNNTYGTAFYGCYGTPVFLQEEKD